jgi:hypothetical protein
MRLHRILVVIAAAFGIVAVGQGSASAAVGDCPPVTHNLTLTLPIIRGLEPCLSANFAGLSVGANHITINLNGFNLSEPFGPLISSNGHSFVTIENGGLGTQSSPLLLNNSHHFTIRNMHMSGNVGGVVMTDGSYNHLLNSTTAALGPVPSVQLIREHGDVIRNVTAQFFQGCKIELDQSSGNRIKTSNFGWLILQGSNRNRIVGNIITPNDGSTTTPLQCALDPAVPGGVTGTGNQNVIRNNTITGGVIALTGFGNRAFFNAFH